MLMIWAGLAGVGAGRGAEDRGLTEQWLASGVSRTRLLLERSAAFGLALAVACLASALGISAIAPLVHQDAHVVGAIGQAGAVGAGLFTCYALAPRGSPLPAGRHAPTELGVGAL